MLRAELVKHGRWQQKAAHLHCGVVEEAVSGLVAVLEDHITCQAEHDVR